MRVGVQKYTDNELFSCVLKKWKCRFTIPRRRVNKWMYFQCSCIYYISCISIIANWQFNHVLHRYSALSCIPSLIEKFSSFFQNFSIHQFSLAHLICITATFITCCQFCVFNRDVEFVLQKVILYHLKLNASSSIMIIIIWICEFEWIKH
jgi:hypothetical protein